MSSVVSRELDPARSARTVFHVEPYVLSDSGPGAIRLGDMLTLPGGARMTVRMVAELVANRFDVSHLMVLGDLDCVVLSAGSKTHLLVPVSSPPPGLSSSKIVASGVASFWSSHIPAAAGGSAEVGFELRMFRTSLAPLVVVTRGVSKTVFVMSGSSPTSSIMVSKLPEFAGKQDSRRFAGAAVPVSPQYDPDPMRARPLPLPRR